MLYAKNFDPNTQDYIMHVQDVDKVELPGILMELSQLYFDQLGTEREEIRPSIIKIEKIEIEVYQCKDCLTVYNEAYGDNTQNILPETPFKYLPQDYKCSLCDAPKSNLKKKTFVKHTGQ